MQLWHAIIIACSIDSFFITSRPNQNGAIIINGNKQTVTTLINKQISLGKERFFYYAPTLPQVFLLHCWIEALSFSVWSHNTKQHNRHPGLSIWLLTVGWPRASKEKEPYKYWRIFLFDGKENAVPATQAPQLQINTTNTHWRQGNSP
jgi:hypothetical protein